jgi:A/G-specific adenine glycosylase
VAAGVICREDGCFLITRRPLNGLLGGLWEFPGGKQEAGERLQQTLQREIMEELGIEIRPNHLIIRVKHAYTHFRITLHAFQATYVGGTVQHLGVSDHAWVSLDDLAAYAFAAADHQIIAALHQNVTQLSLSDYL